MVSSGAVIVAACMQVLLPRAAARDIDAARGVRDERSQCSLCARPGRSREDRPSIDAMADAGMFVDPAISIAISSGDPRLIELADHTMDSVGEALTAIEEGRI